MSETSDLFEIIKSTRAMRRLRPDPVPDALIRKILEAGVCAPNGGNATVTVCHTGTPDLAEETRRAQILIVAAGRRGLIGAEHVRPGTVHSHRNASTGEKLVFLEFVIVEKGQRSTVPISPR